VRFRCAALTIGFIYDYRQGLETFRSQYVGTVLCAALAQGDDILRSTKIELIVVQSAELINKRSSSSFLKGQ
jgi:hypothetical protein